MTTAHPTQQDPPSKMLYGIDETIRVTGLGRSKLYELMAAGRLESVKVGKRRLIPAKALETFVEGLRGSGPSPAA